MMHNLALKFLVVLLLALFCVSERAEAQKRRIRYVTNLASGQRHEVTVAKPYQFSNGSQSKPKAEVVENQRSPNTADRQFVGKSNNYVLPKGVHAKGDSPENRAATSSATPQKTIKPKPKDPQIGQRVPAAPRSRSIVRVPSSRVVVGNRYSGRTYSSPIRRATCSPGRG